MSRLGPRPYAFERKAWHTDTHQRMRGSLVQEIFRVVNEIHNSSTKKNKEWQEKLPVVVLKAEEIMYSKANSEGEYMDLKTLWDRTNDAVNTIIRRDESVETGKLLQPCIEAALNLGCTPRRTKRSQRNCSPRCYLNSATQGNLMADSHCLARFTKPATANVIRSSFESPKYTDRDGYYTGFASEDGSLPSNNQCLPLEKYSVYPLYYGDDLKSEELRHGFGIFHKSISNTVEPAKMSVSHKLLSLDVDFSNKMNQIGVRKSYNKPYPGISCDLSLQLGSLSTPCLGRDQTQETDSIIAEWNRSPAIGKRLSSSHKSNRYDPLNSSLELNELMNVDAATRKRKMLS
ncbi:Detected protein of unknown function [Hibiscus syriacus]|uniref:Histone acetyltransferase n=1 Tax=Hibiscus syriacus TaxID=106335 RepID=A0A6A2Z6Q8_HIBSY|nr:uncharacterized protein LOC120149999 [Hibiscus syriacus]KAE8687671.1 Detected protein of unknown function [Hibiscus syriacus]